MMVVGLGQILVGLGVILASIYFSTIFMREIHGISTIKALIAIITPWIIGFVIAVVLFIVLAATIGAAIMGAMGDIGAMSMYP